MGIIIPACLTELPRFWQRDSKVESVPLYRAQRVLLVQRNAVSISPGRRGRRTVVGVTEANQELAYRIAGGPTGRLSRHSLNVLPRIFVDQATACELSAKISPRHRRLLWPLT